MSIGIIKDYLTIKFEASRAKRSRGGVVVKLLACRAKGPGFDSLLSNTFSEIGYLLLPSCDMAEILLKLGKSSKQPTIFDKEFWSYLTVLYRVLEPKILTGRHLQSNMSLLLQLLQYRDTVMYKHINLDKSVFKTPLIFTILCRRAIRQTLQIIVF